MIDLALGLVRQRLDEHLQQHFSVEEPLVALSPPTDGEGRPAPEVRDRLALFAVSIAEDTLPRDRRGLGRLSMAEPLHLDIHLMLAAAQEAARYGEGLKLLSAAMAFLQAHPVMTPLTTPEMPAGLSQLSLEISNLRPEEMGQLWAGFGGRYLPSVLYKLRSVVIDGSVLRRVDPLVRAPGADVAPEGAP
jgi:hypothetical protein